MRLLAGAPVSEADGNPSTPSWLATFRDPRLQLASRSSRVLHVAVSVPEACFDPVVPEYEHGIGIRPAAAIPLRAAWRGGRRTWRDDQAEHPVQEILFEGGVRQGATAQGELRAERV